MNSQNSNLWKDLSLVENKTLSVFETSGAADFLVRPKVPVGLYELILAGSGLFSLSEGALLFDWILAVDTPPVALVFSDTSSIYSIS